MTEEEERGLIQKMREVGNWSDGVEKRLSVSVEPSGEGIFSLTDALNLTPLSLNRSTLVHILTTVCALFSPFVSSLKAEPLNRIAATNATKELVNPLPTWASSLLSRFPYQDRQHCIDQMTGQLYPGGSGIPPHVDTQCVP